MLTLYLNNCGGIITSDVLDVDLLPNSVEGEFSTASCSTTGEQGDMTTNLQLIVDGATFVTTEPVTGTWVNNRYRILLYDAIELFELAE